MKTIPPQPRPTRDGWRLGNAGRVLSDAVTRFEARVLDLMVLSGHAGTRLPHVNLTRHLDLDGTRITELARRARMTNAAMTELIDQLATTESHKASTPCPGGVPCPANACHASVS